MSTIRLVHIIVFFMSALFLFSSNINFDNNLKNAFALQFLILFIINFFQHNLKCINKNAFLIFSYLSTIIIIGLFTLYILSIALTVDKIIFLSSIYFSMISVLIKWSEPD